MRGGCPGTVLSCTEAIPELWAYVCEQKAKILFQELLLLFSVAGDTSKTVCKCYSQNKNTAQSQRSLLLLKSLVLNFRTSLIEIYSIVNNILTTFICN